MNLIKVIPEVCHAHKIRFLGCYFNIIKKFFLILLQIDLPELENQTSEKIRTFITYLLDSRPGGTTFYVVRFVHL